MKKIVLILSGGMDSTVLLYALLKRGYDVFALSVDYGQRHRKELDAARAVCAQLGVPHEVADLTAIRHLIANSALTSDLAVPEGHYTDDSMKQTVVPNRNMIMLAVAIGYAVSVGAEAVAYGAHAGDHAIYPDCRPEFASAMETAALLANWERVELLRPFVRMTKTDIARAGWALGVPFDKTWSCYNGREFHCGKCGTCTERIEALALAGIPDPTIYETDLEDAR